MDALEKAADRAAREFLKGTYRTVRDFDVTVTRNAILDVLHSSEEPDFIAKICTNGSLGAEARRIIDKVAPHLPTLAGRVVQECRA
jgi:hypothetical protein